MVLEVTGPCYVCFDENAPPSRCNCKDRFIHISCLLKQVQTSGKPTCGVCLIKYDNVELRQSRRMSRRGRKWVCTSVSCMVLLALTIVRTVTLVREKPIARDVEVGRYVEVVFEVFLVAIFLLHVVRDAFSYMRGQWRLTEVDARTVPTRAPQPSAVQLNRHQLAPIHLIE